MATFSIESFAKDCKAAMAGAENRELAPQRPRIGVQRWTPRRIWALSLALGTAYLVVRLIYLNREIAGELM